MLGWGCCTLWIFVPSLGLLLPTRSKPMKKDFFAPPEQPRDDEPFRRGNFSCAYLWREEVSSVDELLKELDALSAADPDSRYLSTLDDINQCSYTCGHAGQDERLELEEPEDEAVDWEDPVQVAAWEQKALQHRVQQLGNPALAQSWEQVCGSLGTQAEDVQALLAVNREPDQLLDEVIYVQRIAVDSDDLKIAAQPNGYFSADWDTFQNHAIIRHLATQYGYRFFAMGAAWMGFVRPEPPDRGQAAQLVADLRELYGKGNDEVHSHAGWAELALLLQERRTLMLGYTEDMAASVGLEDDD